MRLDEDGGHLFLKWKFVRRIWSDMDMEDPRLALLQCKNAAVVFEHLWTLVAHKRDASFVLLWEGWSARNKVNAGGKLRSADDIVYSTRQHIQELKAGMKVANASVASQQILQWQRPPDNTHKVNFDASLYAETGRGAWGCVVRNSQGEFLAARSGYLEHMAGPLHAEMSACVRAVEAAAELGIHRVMFESDSSVLVNALNSDEYDRSTIGVLLRGSHSLCFGNFESFVFSFCKRECNKVAHELAVFGYRAGGVVSSWLEQAPDCLGSLIACFLTRAFSCNQRPPLSGFSPSSRSFLLHLSMFPSPDDFVQFMQKWRT